MKQCVIISPTSVLTSEKQNPQIPTFCHKATNQNNFRENSIKRLPFDGLLKYFPTVGSLNVYPCHKLITFQIIFPQSNRKNNFFILNRNY